MRGEQVPDECPACHQPGEKFRENPSEIKNTDASNLISAKADGNDPTTVTSLSYDKNFYWTDDSCRYMEEIHQMAVTGKSISDAMGTKMSIPSWDDILLLGAQLNPAPLDEDDPVTTMTVIGKNAKRPMILESPMYISHVSFGTLAKGSAINYSHA